MTRLALILALLTGCAAPRAVVIRTPARTHGSGWQLPCGHVLTVAHVAQGDRVTVATRRGPVRAWVLRTGDGWAHLLPERPLRPGDSGSAVLAGAVEARLP